MIILHIVHYPMFAEGAERLSIVDSAWTKHEDAVRRVAWLVAQGGSACIATRYTDDGDLELGDAEDATLAKREPPVRRKAD